MNEVKNVRPLLVDTVRVSLFSIQMISTFSGAWFLFSHQFHLDLKEIFNQLRIVFMLYFILVAILFGVISFQSFLYPVVGSKFLYAIQLILSMVSLYISTQLYRIVYPIVNSREDLKENSLFVQGSSLMGIISSSLWFVSGLYSYFRYPDPHDETGYLTTLTMSADKPLEIEETLFQCSDYFAPLDENNTVIFYYSGFNFTSRDETSDIGGTPYLVRVNPSKFNITDIIAKKITMKDPGITPYIRMRAEEVRQILEQQGKNVLLLGHSYGGLVATQIAQLLSSTTCDTRISLATFGSIYIPKETIKNIGKQVHYLFIGDLVNRINGVSEPTIQEYIEDGPFEIEVNRVDKKKTPSVVWSISPEGVPSSYAKDIPKGTLIQNKNTTPLRIHNSYSNIQESILTSLNVRFPKDLLEREWRHKRVQNIKFDFLSD